MKHFVTIASFNNHASAERYYSWLTEAGISAEISNPGQTDKAAVFIQSKVKSKVRVDPAQAEGARRILRVSAPRLPGLLVCPQCHGSRIEYPQVTRRSVGLYLIFGLLCRIGLLRPRFYCQDCQLTWEPENSADFGRERPRPA